MPVLSSNSLEADRQSDEDLSISRHDMNAATLLHPIQLPIGRVRKKEGKDWEGSQTEPDFHQTLY